MLPPSPERCLNRLNDVVSQFCTGAELPVRFILKEELAELDELRQIPAPKSQVLACARILEALCVSALATPDLPFSGNIFSNLDLLQQFNLIPTTVRYWAHALRRMGNVARHMQRDIGSGDADLAFIYAERCLQWYFCHYRFGPSCSGLTKDGRPLALGGNESLLDAVAQFEQLQSDPRAVEGHWTSNDRCAEASSDFAAALAETLLERNQFDQARAVLDRALVIFPLDLRLRQLDGLYYSRTGRLDQARRKLQPLLDHHGTDDETIGIMAGVYKRLWQAEGGRKWLRKSHQFYARGWQNSGRRNSYLGMNAATTALWLAVETRKKSGGRKAAAADSRWTQSRRMAEQVRNSLLERQAKLAKHADQLDLSLNYWDLATLAESHLLLDDFPAAERCYREAVRNHPQQQANIEVSRQQAARILKAKGETVLDIGDWFT